MKDLFKSNVLSLSLVLLIYFLSGCTPEPVEFKTINNAKIISSNADYARVKADALFYNPNKAGGTLRKVDIVVFYKEQQVAEVSEDSSAKVRGREEFSIPLDINLDLKKVQENWLGNLIRIIQDKSIELHFKGSVKIKMHGISHSIPVDYKEKIKL